jgi:amphiphysin
MLMHQIEFSKALAELYKPISGRPSDPNSYKDEGNPEGIHACEQYEEIVRDLQETLSPELETIDTRIVGPANQLLEVMKAIRKTATKRDHKQLDYDRHRTTLKKLQDKKEKTIKDEKAIFKAEADVEQATEDFQYFNDLLKDELPKFFDLEREFIRPLFTSLYYLQLNIFYTMHERLQHLNIDYFDWSAGPEEVFEKRTSDHKDKADALTITSFKKSGGYKKGEGKYGQKAAGESKYALANRLRKESNAEAPPPPYTPEPSAGTTTIAGSSAVEVAKPDVSSSPPAPPAAAFGGGVPTAMAAVAKAKGPAPPPPKPKPTRLSGQSVLETCTALYKYEAQATGDLSFSAGETIEIIRKTGNDNEWWTGRVNGKTGQFPGEFFYGELTRWTDLLGNYVKLNN